ncbi:hypothetical protein B0T18DRAFT_228981 [Schizothecium vesticola]|uniref:Uncharacterized protein n=1 Tax=Schizothecium vesticola TaxID=314040 RepID=A0AA40EL56_9PEZI|nr:hypothetical protein B0T18DRAFT_228981 [Schizothecium vesticola]
MGQHHQAYIMPFPCGLSVYSENITVEAATLLALTLLITTSLIVTASMARKRSNKSGSATRPPLVPGQHTAGEPPASVAGSDSPVPAAAAPPAPKHTDSRPVASPYGSSPCHVPFASPLTVPKDILLKSPRLHAAFENQLPELPEIPDDVGHILAHFLHTGTYESLRPKETDPQTRQVEELRTSIRAYSAARAYELPKLMRLAEKRIEKYGDGLSLPNLLEVTRDAHPTLSETDTWFLGYLKSRIRPHLQDPKSLLGSNMLDQISSILSPNRVLLRTVLEMFCERMEDRAETPVLEGHAAVVAPPSPPATPSVLQIRSRAIPRTDSPPQRKRSVTPWPSADEATPEPSPMPKRQMIAEPMSREPILSEPVLAEPVPLQSVESQIKAAIQADIKPVVVEDMTAHPWAPVAAPTTPVRQVRSMERHDSAKYMPSTPELDALKNLESPSGTVSDSEPTPFKIPRARQPLLRQVDSGFWDSPIEQEPASRSLSSSILEVEPEYVDVKTPGAVHELASEATPQQDRGAGVHTRDFATPEPAAATLKTEQQEAPLAPEVSSKDPLDTFPDSEAETLSDSKLLDRIAEEDDAAMAKAQESDKPVVAADLDAHPTLEPHAVAAHFHALPHDAEPPRPADAADPEPSVVDPSAPAVAQSARQPAVQDEQPVDVAVVEAQDGRPEPVGAPVPRPEHLDAKDIVVGRQPEAAAAPKDHVVAEPERQRSWRKRLSLRVLGRKSA